MRSLNGKNMVVVGGSGGVGRHIVAAGHCRGAHVLAVARRLGPLEELARQVCGVKILALDATEESAPGKVFAVLEPDILVLCAGAFPPSAPIHRQKWQEFAINWESDVKIAFHFIKEALLRPLAAGSSVILVSSAAAIGGSPISGGYAGAKRTQLFMANYSQKESDRLGLGLRFMALAPRIMPDTELGKYVVAAYSRYLRIATADLARSMISLPTSNDVAMAAIELASNAGMHKGKVFIVSAKGLEATAP